MSEVKSDVEQFVERVQQAAGANVQSIVLYGSAARSDFNEQYSDVNLLVIVRETSRVALDQLAPVVEWWTKSEHQPPPLVITEEELRGSADVFAIETLDLKASHRVLAGRDVLSELDVPMNLHRLQVEHELRSLLLKLRRHYLLARSSERDLQQVLAKSASSVVTLFRHALIALGRPAPQSRRDVVASIALLEGVEAAPLQAALDLREGRRVEAGLDILYQRYMDAIGALVRLIDQVAPKHEWQRMSVSPEGSR